MSEALEETNATRGTRAVRARQRWVSGLMRRLARFELLIDRVHWGLRRRYGHLGPLQVVTYRGFGTAALVILRGRVLEASTLERSLPADSTFRSIRRMVRRFFSRELPEATVCARVGASQVSGTTDDEGYFALPVLTPDLTAGEGWRQAEIEVVGAKVRGLVPARATAEILFPSGRAEFGIISDIDDTVLQTHVTQTLKMMWVTLSGSAFTRMAFDGTSALYRALVRGASGNADNPVFYVSKSPWNLYDFLVDFIDHQGLPRGPLLLRDIGLHDAPPVDHKSASVRELLELYPHLRFVLIGDSGERDPEVYLEVAARYPRRIVAIYIRDLGGKSRKRDAGNRARTLSEQARTLGTELLWIEHANQALSHAQQCGLASRLAPAFE
jgi:phosphatidate phosphatase APP1